MVIDYHKSSMVDGNQRWHESALKRVPLSIDFRIDETSNYVWELYIGLKPIHVVNHPFLFKFKLYAILICKESRKNFKENH